MKEKLSRNEIENAGRIKWNKVENEKNKVEMTQKIISNKVE